MAKTVYLFSGQGSQNRGMGLDFVENENVRKIFEIGSAIMGWDIIAAIREKTKEELGNTLISQPAIFAVSLAAHEMATQSGLKAHGVAGHSLGEYAAMVSSGMLSLEDGFKAIKLRCEAMNRAAQENPGSMAAVLGADVSLIEEVCAEITASGDYVSPVNYNSRAQTVIAGTHDGISKASDSLKAKGVRKIIKLAVSAAFHSKLMESAAKQVQEGLKDFTFNVPDKEFFSNVSGSKLTDFSAMPKYLGTHICSPVKFHDELLAMKDAGYDTFIELGSDKILTGLVKKTLPDVTAFNIENNETLIRSGGE
ncbi:MAG: ACP S-malonyltransferase [Oscillospiraceae bacterium]|nr:ACP S-malonyltransferase [Oscillospiraceae bacterium]